MLATIKVPHLITIVVKGLIYDALLVWYCWNYARFAIRLEYSF